MDEAMPDHFAFPFETFAPFASTAGLYGTIIRSAFGVAAYV